MESYKVIVVMHWLIRNEPIDQIVAKTGVSTINVLEIKSMMKPTKKIDHQDIISRFSGRDVAYQGYPEESYGTGTI